INAVDLKHRFSDVETDCRDRLHAWLPITATAPAAITSMALTRRWGSRPQHQLRTSEVPRKSNTRTAFDSQHSWVTRCEHVACSTHSCRPAFLRPSNRCATSSTL